VIGFVEPRVPGRETISGRARPVRLLVDDLRPEVLVDPTLDRRPLVVGLVHRSRQRDELRAEIPGPLALAEPVLDRPLRLIDRAQLGRQARHPLVAEDRPVPRHGQGGQLDADVLP
jgi:hypothetical protein